MKRILPGLLLLLCFGSSVVGQNIVPNPTFVEFTQCPSSYSQIERCKHWRAPTIAVSTDYYHECHDTLTGGSGMNGVPSNGGTSYQPSASGSYIGLYSYIGADTKEYASTDIPALEPGTAYRVLITVSLLNICRYGTNGLGVYFYNDKKPDTTTTTTITHTPQIDYSFYGAITDTQNWVTLVDTFVADSSYQHMVIGCFKSDLALTKVSIDTDAAMISYYLIDSVAVEKFDGSVMFLDKNNRSVPQAGIYPQPFKDKAVLNITNGAPGSAYELNIYNMQGVHVRKAGGLRAGQTTIYRDGLPPGMYLYQVQTAGQKPFMGKMMVE